MRLPPVLAQGYCVTTYSLGLAVAAGLYALVKGVRLVPTLLAQAHPKAAKPPA